MDMKFILHAVNVAALKLLIAHTACARCYDFRKRQSCYEFGKRQETLQVVGVRGTELIVDSYLAAHNSLRRLLQA
jgi:hypothetical protein